MQTERPSLLRERRGLQLTHLCASCCCMPVHMPSSKRTSNSSVAALSPTASLDSFSAVRNLNNTTRSREKHGQELGTASFLATRQGVQDLSSSHRDQPWATAGKSSPGPLQGNPAPTTGLPGDSRDWALLPGKCGPETFQKPIKGPKK